MVSFMNAHVKQIFSCEIHLFKTFIPNIDLFIYFYYI